MAKKQAKKPKKKKKAASMGDPSEWSAGTVIRSVGSSSRVLGDSGEWVDCVVRGKFRIQGINSTNPVAVGDRVHFMAPKEPEELGVITELLPRKNYILRKAATHNRKVHILCANVDQALLLFTIDFPTTSTGFADRYLVVTEAYDIPTKIVINKIDLLETEEQQARLAEVTDMYRNLGYEVIHISALDESYQDTVADLLVGKTSFIGGHSGSGKSTLINMIDPDLNLKTSEISEATTKGRHTTTYAEMHPLVTGGAIIDSPGIRELGLAQFEREELGHYFREIRDRMGECKFHNCLHLQEPHCAVKAAVESGEIHYKRYESYLRLLDEIEEGKDW
ncbi:ribosome small subunit-dependent GTPase A [Pontibacter sp. G13]|uniref:ribosome small subunit-dependent GTPase A n=1 Tax=Pontibacter sp. G13 TaxID=3074898 RepID=UPI002889684A|nr:ribosome small subunit-dependent GTPase A [Pontibacter sp. G13]WNJ16766.1 ribosome small subunit-dependent GTPase A [Pontibacter sp. G13]